MMTEITSSSRPVYGTIEPVAGARHLFMCDEDGLDIVLNAAKKIADEDRHAAQLIVIGRDHKDVNSRIEKCGIAQHYRAPSFIAGRQAIDDILDEANTRTILYLAGSEQHISRTMSAAIAKGILLGAIQTEHRGSNLRRMQCVHCKGITENVSHDPFQCSHCGLHLFVRDHYSRRIGAFQGVCIDAEDPGNVPESVERFK